MPRAQAAPDRTASSRVRLLRTVRVDARAVVGEHPGRGEARAAADERFLDPFAPAVRYAVGVALVEERYDLVLDERVELVRVAGISVFRSRAVAGNRPAVRTVVRLRPPAVEHAQVEAPVEDRLHPARSARLEPAHRQVHPDVAACDELATDGEVVVLEEGDTTAFRLDLAPQPED